MNANEAAYLDKMGEIEDFRAPNGLYGDKDKAAEKVTDNIKPRLIGTNSSKWQRKAKQCRIR